MGEPGFVRRLVHARRPQSVRLRITLVAVVVTTAAVSAGGWLLIRSVEGSQRGEIRQDNEDLFDTVASRLREGVEPMCLVESLDPTELSVARVTVVDQNGDRYGFTSSYDDRFGMQTTAGHTAQAGATAGAEGDIRRDCEVTGEGRDMPAAGGKCEEADCAPAAGGDGTTDTASDDEERNALTDTVGYPVESVSGVVTTPDGDVSLTVTTPVDQVTESIDAVRNALLIGLPAAMALVAVASWLLVGRALRPVETIRSEAEAIGGTTLDRRVPEHDSRDEIGRLARTTNAMLDRLESSARRQRQFVADASHELRSPLAAIRTDLEVALLEGDRGDWRAAVRDSLREEARLEGLLADLLILAAEDEGAAAAPFTPIDIAAIVEEEAARPRSLTPSITTSANRTVEERLVAGSGRQLRRVVANLLDNAARHAEAEVHVGVEGVVGHVRLTVDDDGPGMPVADRERVFERFTRLDDGRAREDGGAGLGLAVVRSIVARHGGTVHVDDSPLGGARLVVTLPAPDTT